MRAAVFLVLTPGQVLSLVVGVLLFAALLVFSFWALRWIQKRGFASLSGKHIQVLERTMLGRDSAVLLLRIGARLIAVGQSREGLSFLCELHPEDFSGEMEKETGHGEDNFLSRFIHNMKVNARILPKGTPHRRPGGEQEPGSVKETSFEDVLKQMAAREESRNPTPGGNSAPRSGYTPVKGQHSDSGNRRGDYQASLERLKTLSEPDYLDRKESSRPKPRPQTIPYRSPQPPAAPPAEPLPVREVQSPVVTPLPAPAPKRTREEKIDELLDRIAERQSRYNKE